MYGDTISSSSSSIGRVGPVDWLTCTRIIVLLIGVLFLNL